MGETTQEMAIRRYRPGDEIAISALFREVFSVPLNTQQWQWKYRRPVNGSKCYVAHDRNGRLMGHAGAIGLRGRYMGMVIPVYQICDVMIHPEARGHLGTRNLFTRLARTLLEDIANSAETVFAYGFPGRRPYILGERAGVYQRIEQGHELRLEPVKSFTMIRMEPVDWDDPRLDALWARIGVELELSLIRDRAYLQWRYAENPFRDYRLVGLRSPTRQLGWAVLQTDGPVIRIIDLLCHRVHLDRIMRALRSWAVREGCTELVTWLPAHWRDKVQGTVIETEVVTTNMVWHLPIPTSVAANALYYTMGDLDIY